MKHYATVAMLAVVLCGIHGMLSSALYASPLKSDNLCGPKCVAIACNRLGITAELGEIVDLTGYTSASGTTMLGLLRAIKAKGLYAAGMKISADELAGFNGPAIAHFWDNHFVVVEGGGADTIKMTSPAGKTKLRKKEDFRKFYSGFALLIAKDAAALPEPKTDGSDLRFDNYRWDFGSVFRGEQKRHSFTCHNVGNSDLIISSIGASCPECLIPGPAPQPIPPGGEGKIDLLLLTEAETELSHVSKKLFIESNDPVSPVVQLEVTGYIRPEHLTVSPTNVDFGNVYRADVASRSVYIPNTPDNSLRVTSATSSSPYVTATLSPSVDKNRPGYMMKVTLGPGAPIGEMKCKVTIVSNYPKKPEIELPVRAYVTGNIETSPDSFFFGFLTTGQTHQASVKVFTRGKEPLTILKVDNSLPHVTVHVTDKINGKEYILVATLSTSAPIGTMSGDIVVHTSDPDQPMIRIPVYAHIKE